MILKAEELQNPENCQHQWKEMHHYEDPPSGYGSDLWHYCPTGFKRCTLCLKTELNDSEEQCRRWGKWGNTKCIKCDQLLIRISYPNGCFSCTDAGYCSDCKTIYTDEGPKMV